MSEERDALIAQVAYWYYVKGQGLSKIAKRIDRSVSMASRMLQEARDRELVEIRINYPLSRAAELELQLEEKFGIEKAHVFSEPSALPQFDHMERFGSLGASVLKELLIDARSVGVSWGSQVYAIVNELSTSGNEGEGKVFQTSGALGATESMYDGARICQKLAEKLNFEANLLHAPLIVDTPHVAEVLRDSPTIKTVLNAAGQSDVALISVGSPYFENSGLRTAGYLRDADISELEGCGVVGDIMGYHVDSQGIVVDTDINKRVVGLDPSRLAGVKNTVIAATGIKKADAIRAALRGELCNTLITDKVTAQRILSC